MCIQRHCQIARAQSLELVREAVDARAAPQNAHASELAIERDSRVEQRGTDTSVFTPAVTEVSRVANSRKFTGNAERFLEDGFAATGAQKAWCQILNVSLPVSAHEDFASPLDYAILALMHNIVSSRHPWRVLFDRMPDEPLTFVLGEFVQGFSGYCYEDNEKVDLCVALSERRHWLQMSAMRNAIQAFKAAANPLEPFAHTILELCLSSTPADRSVMGLVYGSEAHLADRGAVGAQLPPLFNRGIGMVSYHRGLV
ncbi:hypothetical protein PHMEG_0004800 [Phytophthora megakarya]|uniref:Uncharacterized protein n=1 Tax=Phytophthora megakarya TaxID=4795 RepID=A0A225WUH4_9STRA|nr:hypothetical protein PHMEG_0004800 [Phytophthora megakarya]